MADIKTNLRELSVATTIGILTNNIDLNPKDLYDAKKFFAVAEKVISNDLSNAINIKKYDIFTGDLKQIVDNGYKLGKAIYENSHFSFEENPIITWQGNDTQKEDPIDITVGNYGFSLKEESFILENMGLYKLLNCYTGSNYKKRHIFSDYARKEYEEWFTITWNELLVLLNKNNGIWTYNNAKKQKSGIIERKNQNIILKYIYKGKLNSESILPINCTLLDFENNTCSKTRENVFSKFINMNLEDNNKYNSAKKTCAIAASNALSEELNRNLNYNFSLPRFLRIHEQEYYYAKTTSTDITIFRVPSKHEFGSAIVIESICPSVPDKQANILTTIKNRNTGKTLILRNECRFSHGQFNGTPEAKMYYENGGSLEVIYEKI